MKKIVFVIITLISVALLSSCSGTPELPPITDLGTPVAAAPAAAPEAPTIDLADASRYAYLDTAGPEVPQASEAELLDYANMACRGLVTDGYSPTRTALVLRAQRGLTDLESAAVVGSAMGSGFCDNVWVRSY